MKLTTHFSLLASLVILGVLSACSTESGDQPQGPPGPEGSLPVVVEAVEHGSRRTRLQAVGTSRALRSVSLYPATAGEVVAVNFRSGQAVERGDVLLELDRRSERLAVDLAEIRVADAERLHERYRESAGTGATLPTTLDEAETALSEARVELERAQVALEDRYVRAPFSGYVGIRDVDEGDRIQTSTEITTLDDRSVLLVSFEVPEIMLGDLQEGDNIALTTWNARSLPQGGELANLDSSEEQSFPGAALSRGEVVELDSRVNPETRTFMARARVDNSADQMRPGQSFRVGLDVMGEDYPVVPEIAVQWGADGSFVWRVQDNEVGRVAVNIIQRQDSLVLVEGRLEEGDLVVVEGIQRLRPGAEVEAQLADRRRDVGSLTRVNGDRG